MRFFILFFSLFTLVGQSQQLDPKYKYQPGGPVFTMLEKDGKIYMGGSFNTVGPPQRGLAYLDDQRQPVDGCPAVTTGQVYSIVPDGTGGWFIGGSFTTIGGKSIGNLARLNPDRTVDESFNKKVSSTVRTIVVLNGILYIGGAFLSVNGVTRNRFAAIDLATGELTNLNPAPNNTVYTMVPSQDGTIMYFGGTFTSVISGGTSYPRTRLAAFTIADGALTGWAPNVNNQVNSLVVYGSNIYAGGNFSAAGGISTYKHLAAFNTSGSVISTFTPQVNNYVYGMALSGSTLYFGGTFTKVGTDSTRNRAAAISLSNNTLTDFIPDIMGTGSILVNTIAVSGTTVALGGQFTVVKGGVARNNLATFNAATGDPLPWEGFFPGGGQVYSVTFDGNSLLLGGLFLNVGYIRNNIAALDASTGDLTSWNPNLGSACSTIVAAGNTIYAGGAFTTVDGGINRNRIAAFDATTGIATSWNPSADGDVKTLAVSQDGSTIYAGGSFTKIGGQTRNLLAAIATSDTGTATAWNPNVTGTSPIVYTIVAGTSTVYVGGKFTNAGGIPRNNLAGINISDGSATAWDPNLDGTVNALALDGTTLYAGGSFALGGTTTRYCLAAYDNISTNPALNNWDPSASGAVYSLAVTPSSVYAGGTFSSMNTNTTSVARNRIAALNKTDGKVNENFNLNAIGTGVYSLFPSTNLQRILIGGSFTSVSGSTQLNLAFTQNPDDPALPVELTSFSAKMINGKVNLFWETKTEIDNHGFEVERSVAGAGWEKLGFVEGHGTSNSPKYYSFTDSDKPLCKTSYRLKQIDNDGTIDYSHTVEVSGELPSKVTLEQNFPNPFNPETVIRYALPASGSAIAGRVLIKVYDVTGKEVATPVNQSMEAGNHSVVFNATASGLPSGVYLYRLTVTTADGRQFTQTRKMMLMK